MCHNVIIKREGDTKMILFTNDYKKSYKETPSGTLFTESQDLMVPSGIITMYMATYDEKVAISEIKP